MLLMPRGGGGGGGRGHSGLNRYPLPNGREERKRRMPKFRDGRLRLGQKQGAVNFKLGT